MAESDREEEPSDQPGNDGGSGRKGISEDKWTGRDRIEKTAAALKWEVHEYLARVHEIDRTLRVEKGIAVITMAWAPLWLLVLALTFSPQGRDLLQNLSSNSAAALVFVAALFLLCGVATFGATALAAAWLFPWIIPLRSVDERGPLEALSPEQAKTVVSAALWPIRLSIGLPITYLAASSFMPVEFQIVPLLIFGVWACLFWFTIQAVAQYAVRVLHRIVPIENAMMAVISATIAIVLIGWQRSDISVRVPIHILSVVTAILWLLVVFGITFAIYGSRYERTRHIPLLLLLAIPVVLMVLRATVLPEDPLYISDVTPAKAPSTRPALERLLFDSGKPAEAPAQIAIAPRRTLKDTLLDFKKAHENETRPPLVLVTAAGGGIRAAFWSASVLSKLHDDIDKFSSHVFAISAVSGGALGSSVYKMLTTVEGAPACPEPLALYRTCAARFLRQDFIGPNIMSAATAAIIAVATRGFVSLGGRDTALENAWIYNWHKIIPDAISFDAAFDELFIKQKTPSLLLNGTSTKSGNRVITSNLDIASLRRAETPANADVIKTGCIVDNGIVNPAQYTHLSISSAVLTSARFPYITPPGLLHLPKSEPAPGSTQTSCRDWEEIVDGGFVDNEGIITMRELLDKLIELEGGPDNLSEHFQLIVIRLSAEPSPVALRHGSVAPPPRDNLDQLFSTVMNQRTAAGQNLVADFKKQIRDMRGIWVEFNAIAEDAPLGWSLSLPSQNRLNAWLDGPQFTALTSLIDAPTEDLKTAQEFAAKTDMPGRFDSVRAQFDGLKASKQKN